MQMSLLEKFISFTIFGLFSVMNAYVRYLRRYGSICSQILVLSDIPALLIYERRDYPEIFHTESLTRTVFGFVGDRVTVIVDELASCRYLGWARFVSSSATLRSSPRVKVVVLRTMRVTMRFVPFSPRFDVFVDSIDEPEQRDRAIQNVDRKGNR